MRIRTILAAAAVPAALAASLLGATAASAAPNPNPGNGAVVITSQTQADNLMNTTRVLSTRTSMSPRVPLSSSGTSTSRATSASKASCPWRPHRSRATPPSVVRVQA